MSKASTNDNTKKMHLGITSSVLAASQKPVGVGLNKKERCQDQPLRVSRQIWQTLDLVFVSMWLESTNFTPTTVVHDRKRGSTMSAEQRKCSLMRNTTLAHRLYKMWLA